MKILWAIVYWLSAIVVMAQGNPPESLLISVQGAPAVPPSSLLTGLVSFWGLDEVPSTRFDYVGDNDAEPYGTGFVPTNVIGQLFTNSCSFSNASALYLQVADADNLSGSNVSFSAWIRPQLNADGTFPNNQEIAGKYRTSPSNREWFLNCGTNSSNVRLVYQYSTNLTSADGQLILNTGQTISQWTGGNWYHVSFVADSSGPTWKGWLRGTNSALSFTNITMRPGSPPPGASPLFIGKGVYSSSISFSGLIDDVGWWSTSKTSNEMFNIYHYGTNGSSYPWTGRN